jgi:signal transduction histidine kinase
MVVAMPIVMWLAAATSAQISRRVARLRAQVEHIAEGEFQQITVPDRDDEIRALSQSVNRMAAMLAGYESEVRRTERMRTLATLGGGVAHQLRNSVTGCSIALDLHVEECSAGGSCASLDVARRQLRLMEEYIQRFLQLGKREDERRHSEVDLTHLIDDLLPLVRPTAQHSGVDLQWRSGTPARGTVLGDTADLSQLVINLVLNAVEAAAQNSAISNTPGRVVITFAEQPPDHVVLTISDNGRGPADEVRETLFEPFITEKPSGIGLGLSVARDVALLHGGRIDWRRAGGLTEFVVELPVVGAASRAAHVAASLRDAVPSFGETPLPGGPARLAGPTATLYS